MFKKGSDGASCTQPIVQTGATHFAAKSQHWQGLSGEDVAAAQLAPIEADDASTLALAMGDRTSPMLTSMATNALHVPLLSPHALPMVHIDAHR
jgi:hypothetical protein